MKKYTNSDIISFIQNEFQSNEFIPLHAPVFKGNEKKYLLETIDSTMVSSIGPFVNRFEEELAKITGSSYAIAIVNGTSALHLALLLAGVEAGDEVITQPLTFIATCNALSYIKAYPSFIDIDHDTLGMSPVALQDFLKNDVVVKTDGRAYNRHTGRRIAACVPMHTFGYPCRIDEIAALCEKYNIFLVEDCAESLGSYYKGKHTGCYGKIGIFSLNGNKIVTCGGGGAIVTNDMKIAKRAKHLSTQAKVPHRWAFIHDEIAYNYRMPNLNAALACAQLEKLDVFLQTKRELAAKYSQFFSRLEGVKYFEKLTESKPNFWLNTIVFENERDQLSFLTESNDCNVMTRPVWELMHKLELFKDAFVADVNVAEKFASRIVNIPSSVHMK